MSDDVVKDVTVKFLNVTDAELRALALLAKRMSYQDIRTFADSRGEAEMMASGVGSLHNILRDKGYG